MANHANFANSKLIRHTSILAEFKTFISDFILQANSDIILLEVEGGLITEDTSDT